MTRMTAMLIKVHGDDIRCEAVGPDASGLYAGWISFWKDGRPHIMPLIETPYCFATAGEASDAMRKGVEEIRASPDL